MIVNPSNSTIKPGKYTTIHAINIKVTTRTYGDPKTEPSINFVHRIMRIRKRALPFVGFVLYPASGFDMHTCSIKVMIEIIKAVAISFLRASVEITLNIKIFF